MSFNSRFAMHAAFARLAAWGRGPVPVTAGLLVALAAALALGIAIVWSGATTIEPVIIPTPDPSPHTFTILGTP